MNWGKLVSYGVMLGLFGGAIVAMFEFFNFATAAVGSVVFVVMVGATLVIMRLVVGGGAGGGQARSRTVSKGAGDER